jgi:hypothetical protein
MPHELRSVKEAKKIKHPWVTLSPPDRPLVSVTSSLPYPRPGQGPGPGDRASAAAI